MIIILLLVVIILLAYRNKNILYERVLKDGILENEEHYNGEIFYMTSCKNSDERFDYYTYVRLNNGEDITIRNEDVYKNFHIGMNIKIIERVYIYKKRRFNLYIAELNNSEHIRLY